MGETHGPTEGRGQALGRKFLSSLRMPPQRHHLMHVVTPRVHRTPGSTSTILRKLHQNELTASTSASPTVSSTSTVFSPLAVLSRLRSCNVQSPPDAFVTTVQPDIAVPRTKSDTTASSTRRPLTPTPFQACGHSARDHLRGGCGCEEPVVPLMVSREAWKVMGRRFQNAHKASPHELVPARRPFGYKAQNLNRSVPVQGGNWEVFPTVQGYLAHKKQLPPRTLQ
ncbi:hypothetical protein T484DRAFT_2664131 [Baffinella frigidus]|nr:hypothetical protein T484DRAFT_2664131 [Cryptophyta sp. CCMP2293]